MGFSRKCIYSIFKKIFKWIAANGKHLELLSTWEMTFKRDFAKKLGFMGKDCIKENKDKFPEQMSLNIQHTHQESKFDGWFNKFETRVFERNT